MYICRFCEIEKKNDNSLRNHERLCKKNENKQTTWFQENQKLVFQRRIALGAQNGATKAKTEGREFIVSEITRKKHSVANKLRSEQWHVDNGKKIAVTVQQKVKDGEWHTSLARHMHIDYKGIDLHGTWELKYAQYLDANDIKWIRNKDTFKYIFDDKERLYTPDFYLLDSDEYVEVKGYKTAKDNAKWSQFPYNRKLIVLMATELKSLGIKI